MTHLLRSTPSVTCQHGDCRRYPYANNEPMFFRFLRLLAARAVCCLACALTACATRAELPAALTRLSALAVAALDAQLDPPPARITLSDWAEREAGVIERAQMRRVYVAAVDALLAQAAAADGKAEIVTEVRDALNELARRGNSPTADRLFVAQAEAAQARGAAGRAEAALAWRHSVALAEFPVAMAGRGGRFDPRAINTGHTMKPLGALALPGLERAARLDGSDPWSWVMVAWLAGRNAAPDVPTALQTAVASTGDDTLALAAALALAQQQAWQGRPQEAAQTYTAAFQRTQQAIPRLPAPAGVQQQAFGLHRMAEFKAALGQPRQAFDVLKLALLLRERVANALPDNVQAQWDLIATHSELSKLSHGTGEAGHLAKAMTLASALQQRDRYTPLYTADSAATMAGAAVRAGGALALVLGLGLLALYRWRVGRWMRAAASGIAATPVAVGVAAPRASAPVASILHSVADGLGAAPRSAALAGARVASRRAGAVQVLAGLAYAGIATLLYFWSANISFLPWRFLVTAWMWVMPAMLVLCLLWTGDRRRQAAVLAVYLAVLAVFCIRMQLSGRPPVTVVSSTLVPFSLALPMSLFTGPQFWSQPTTIEVAPWVQPLLVTWMHASALLPLLLFADRRVRAIGPVLVTLVIVLCIGGVVSSVVLSTTAGHALQARWYDAGVPHGVSAAFGLGAVLAAPLAWLAGQVLAKAHRAKWLNDHSLVFDAIWLFQTFLLVSMLTDQAGAAGVVGFAAFAVYKAVTLLGMYSVAQAARSRPSARLLLLRVFGQRRRTERLFDRLTAHWRYAGPVQMIGAPDVAARSIDADEFMDFISGKLRHHFVIEPGDLPRRVAELDLRPDTDGRFRVNDIYCGADTWQPAVRALMAATDLCLMDLRDFSQSNQGCLLELQALMELVPARAILLLINENTDQVLLAHTLHDCHARLSPGAANAGALPSLATLAASGYEMHTVRGLLAWADPLLAAAAAVTPATPPSSSGLRVSPADNRSTSP